MAANPEIEYDPQPKPELTLIEPTETEEARAFRLSKTTCSMRGGKSCVIGCPRIELFRTLNLALQSKVLLHERETAEEKKAKAQLRDPYDPNNQCLWFDEAPREPAAKTRARIAESRKANPQPQDHVRTAAPPTHPDAL